MPKPTENNITAFDDSCGVDCACGAHVFIASENVYRCVQCGRGYRLVSEVLEYAPDEHEMGVKELADINSWIHTGRLIVHKMEDAGQWTEYELLTTVDAIKAWREAHPNVQNR